MSGAVGPLLVATVWGAPMGVVDRARAAVGLSSTALREPATTHSRHLPGDILRRSDPRGTNADTPAPSPLRRSKCRVIAIVRLARVTSTPHLYSAFSDAIGSTRAARRAGAALASTAVRRAGPAMS